MKKTFTIQEIANLYNIGVDSIRYYEKKGLISPLRGDNGYRYYSLDDISRMNIIRDLLGLSFSTEQIKEYLDDFNLDKTLAIMGDESKHIEEELKRLKDKQISVQNRIAKIKKYRYVEIDRITLKYFNTRNCKEIETRINSDAQTDLVIRILQRDNIKHLSSLGNLVTGAIPALERHRVIPNVFQSVFVIDDSNDFDFQFEEGDYLSIYYRGSYDQATLYFKTIKDYALEHDYIMDGLPFEIYHIDNRYTDNLQEYITEVQVKVIPKK